MQLVDNRWRRGGHDRASQDRGELHQHDGAQDPVTAIGRNLVGKGWLWRRRGGRAGFGVAQDVQSTCVGWRSKDATVDLQTPWRSRRRASGGALFSFEKR